MRISTYGPFEIDLGGVVHVLDTLGEILSVADHIFGLCGGYDIGRCVDYSLIPVDRSPITITPERLAVRLIANVTLELISTCVVTSAGLVALGIGLERLEELPW